jgi:hypothetical protein
MWPFPRRELTTRQLLELQLKRWNGRLSSFETRTAAANEIAKITEHLIALDKKDSLEKIPERIKALEQAYQELLMMGK